MAFRSHLDRVYGVIQDQLTSDVYSIILTSHLGLLNASHFKFEEEFNELCVFLSL